jgi:uncharacterized membrane protein (UPF0136 family)
MLPTLSCVTGAVAGVSINLAAWYQAMSKKQSLGYGLGSVAILMTTSSLFMVRHDSVLNPLMMTVFVNHRLKSRMLRANTAVLEMPKYS